MYFPEHEGVGIWIKRMEVADFYTTLPERHLISAQGFVDDIAMVIKEKQVKKVIQMVDDFLGAYSTKINDKCEIAAVGRVDMVKLAADITTGKSRRNQNHHVISVG
eukprot:TRINITY_DN11109_c0_g1_i11.p1 TRINITY_DN11109_c0_g1~~TRINITY_DN11109_c0_g1_i11.p1  ORF type:complete len:106 (+),score=10.27 TRINITY_DN11109_c0_g1_i11:373-690(+)